MAHLWVQDLSSRDWSVVTLDGAAAADAGSPVLLDDAEAPSADTLLFDVGGLWVLIAPETVYVNGSPLVGGVRVLRDRDEIRVGLRRVFFDEEEPARVVPFPGGAQPVHCPRCLRPVSAGEPAVHSRCGVWHHQTDEFPCWTYSPSCSQCDQPSALDAGYAWSPDIL